MARGGGSIDWQGKTLGGRFEVGKQLGRGGMAIIYHALDTLLERDVAIKILRSDRDGGEEHRDRLYREARAIARLNHPHIVTVHDVGMVGDIIYIVMELLEGADVAELLEIEGRLSLPLALEIGRQVASALAAAHAKDIVHRDIKPENLFVVGSISGAIAKLLDFSVAKIPHAKGRKKLTQSGSVFGTPHYMAPEQIRADPVGQQADIYALGTVLFEIVTGEPPYDAPTPLQLFEMHVTAPVPDLDDRIPDAPDGLAELVSAMLAKSPEDRPQGALVVGQRLSALLDDVLARGHADETQTERLPAIQPPAKAAPAKARPGGLQADRTAEMTPQQIARATAELTRLELPEATTMRPGARVEAPGAVKEHPTFAPSLTPGNDES